MFESLSDRLSGVFDRLTKQGALSEDDVRTALREVRVALLEADVSLPVARDFVKAVQDKATGQAVTKSVTPGQQVVKIVHDELVHVLAGDTDEPGKLKIDNPPAPILMVGLQGSGKTTTTAKLAKRLKDREGKRVLMASLDTNRPAAMDQLAILGVQIGVDTLPIVKGQSAVDIAKRAKQQAALGGYDVYMLDTAGRLSIDEELMSQVEQVRNIANPRETLLVVDGLTGQDAVHTAENFDQRIGVTGVVLTRMDGDGRGGAALSMRAVTGKPIKFVGLGEKMDALEEFHPERIAGRILGMGDIVSLVEKAQETIEAEQAERMMKRFQKGQFNMNDLKMQLEQMMKMGGMEGIMGMMPGMKKMKGQMDEAGDGRHRPAPPDRPDPVDDEEGTRQSGASAGLPQEADRQGGWAGSPGTEPFAQDAAADVGHDEKDGQDGRPQGAGPRAGDGRQPGRLAARHGPRRRRHHPTGRHGRDARAGRSAAAAGPVGAGEKEMTRACLPRLSALRHARREGKVFAPAGRGRLTAVRARA
jgi:signal recognition particle subunit SRP54